jgi:hypothetical protein
MYCFSVKAWVCTKYDSRLDRDKLVRAARSIECDAMTAGSFFCATTD